MSLQSHFPFLLNRLSSLIVSPKPLQLRPAISSSLSRTSELTKYWCVKSQSLHTSAVDGAARKGTRARRDAIKKANKKKKIEEEVKKGWTPFHERKTSGTEIQDGPKNYTWKKLPPEDDVYISEFFRWPEHTIPEAVAKLRQTHQPTMYNSPDATVLLSLEVSLTTDKAKRFLDDVSGILLLPHQFETGQSRSVAVLTDCPDTRVKVHEMGVQLVGGKDIVKLVLLVLAGEIDLMSYDYVVSSLDILPDLVPLRGLLKKKFPTPNYGTACTDVVTAASRFLSGLSYTCVKAPNVRSHGNITVPFGTLSMEDDHLTANAVALLKDIDAHRKKHKSSDVIYWGYVRCLSTNELIVLDHNSYLGRKKPEEKTSDEEKSELPAHDAVQVSN
ncbi:Ribosomal protein L1/ribosomal biogenesis protein [Trinorchestia longiramus]|nr:Ribosomal protein L1/ribosomal biogenesis protein [Trinorchestia longiramus]